MQSRLGNVCRLIRCKEERDPSPMEGKAHKVSITLVLTHSAPSSVMLQSEYAYLRVTELALVCNTVDVPGIVKGELPGGNAGAPAQKKNIHCHNAITPVFAVTCVPLGGHVWISYAWTNPLCCVKWSVSRPSSLAKGIGVVWDVCGAKLKHNKRIELQRTIRPDNTSMRKSLTSHGR